MFFLLFGGAENEGMFCGFFLLFGVAGQEADVLRVSFAFLGEPRSRTLAVPWLTVVNQCGWWHARHDEMEI